MPEQKQKRSIRWFADSVFIFAKSRKRSAIAGLQKLFFTCNIDVIKQDIRFAFAEIQLFQKAGVNKIKTVNSSSRPISIMKESSHLPA